ncbi:MAG: lytic murein transglycosylase [Sphingomonadales bacterium]|nr:lytic murein transglycosylase [Sphingomonadales bacterium]
MRFGSKFLALVALIAAMTVTAPALAQDAAGFQPYLMSLRTKALAQGISAATFDATVPGLTYNARVVELDRDQPGGSPNSAIPPFAPYQARHVDAARIGDGRAKYRELRPLLSRIEQQTGVPESIMVAIYGHETSYGRVLGGFDLPQALATLAYEGRRRDLFEGEFLATLKMIDMGVPRSRLQGSWAGAFGYPQFLPSVWLRLAMDGDGDGDKEIWSSEPDGLASIANYLSNAGWRPNVPWGVPVGVPASLDRASLGNKTVPTRCPRVHERHSRWKTMAEWRALGVYPAAGRWASDDTLATLLEPDGPGQRAYLLTNNYRVILDYNCSNFYALSVGILADEVSQ